MASAYSILRNYGEYIQPYDFNLLQRGLEYKQQKYDANAAKLDSQVEEYLNMDLIKEEDREYLKQKLSTLASQVNKYGGDLDLGKNGVTRDITNHLKQALDENVLNAYQGTKAFRSLQSSIEEIKQKKPELYSSINEAYAMQGAREWLSDGKAGTQYKGGSYTPYTDVAANKVNLLKDLYKDSESTIETVEMRMIDGKEVPQKVKRTFKGLDDEQIGAIFEGTLNPQELKQLQINSWGTYQQQPERTNEIFNNYAKGRLQEVDRAIAQAKSKGDNEAIKRLNITKQNLNTSFDNMKGNIAAIGNFLEKENVIGGLKSQFRKRQIGFEFEEDATFWKAQDHALKNAKLMYDIQKDKDELGVSSTGLSSTLTTFKEGGEPVSDFNQEELFNNKLTNAKSEARRQAEVLLRTDFSDMSPVIKEEVALYIEAHPEVSREDALINVLDSKIAKGGIKNSIQLLNFREAYDKYKDVSREHTEVYNKTKEDLNKAVENKLNLVFEEGNINFRTKYNQVLSGDGITLVPDSEFTGAQGQRRFQDLTSDEKTKVKRLVLADVINSKFIDKDTKGLGYYVDLLSETFDEQGEVDEDITRTLVRTGDGSEPRDVVSLKYKGGEKTAKFLEATKKASIYNSPNFGRDNSIMEDGDFYQLNEGIGEFIEQTRKNYITPRIREGVGRTVISAEPLLDAKGSVKRSKAQQAIFTSVGQAVSDKDTELLVDGERKFKKDFSSEEREYFEKLDFTTDSIVTVKPDSGVQGKALVTLQDGTQILVRDTIIENNFNRIGLDYNREAIQDNEAFITDNVTRKSKVKKVAKGEVDKNLGFYEQALGGFSQSLSNGSNTAATPLNTITPRTALMTLSRNVPLDERSVALSKNILENAEGLNTELSISDGNINFRFENENGQEVFSKSIGKNNFSTVKQSQDYFKNLERTLRVNPNYFVYKMVESVIIDEKQNKGISEYTLEEINQLINSK